MKKYTRMLFPAFKDKALTLSYDDGVVADKRLIGILNEYGLKCTFNINSELFSNGRRLSVEDAVKLYSNSGHEVAVHGAKHLSLADVSDAMATRDIVADKENLEKLFGKIVYGMAYGNGSCNERVADIVQKCGICFARTTVSTEKFDIPENWLLMPATCHHNNARLNELADSFLNEPSKSPKLFYLWGHSYEFDNNNNWEIIENFAKKMGHRDDVYYATNGQIYLYVQAYESLVFSSDGKIVYNPTYTDVYLRVYDKKVCIGAGQTVVLE